MIIKEVREGKLVVFRDSFGACGAHIIQTLKQMNIELFGDLGDSLMRAILVHRDVVLFNVLQTQQGGQCL